MSWMLILFAIAIVLSPIMWFKQSPHQKNLAETRSAARSLGIQVNLHRRPDARDSETALEVTCYKMRCSLWGRISGLDNSPIQPARLGV